jgi:DNA-binding response OmpR family regulator
MVFSSAGGNIKTIMIVDEEPMLLKRVKKFLEQENVEVVTVHDSRQALEQLKEDNEETFDLILVNTRMPGSKKTTALFSMKPTEKKQPRGIENFLQKPFTKEQFLDFIKEQMSTD